MPDPFGHVEKGQPIRFVSTAWNAMLDAGKAFRADAINRGVPPLTTTRSSALVRVRNDSGADVDRGGVLGLNGPVFTPTDSADAFLQEATFRGVTPAVPDHAGKFCVLLEPAAADRVVRGWVAGVCQVRLNVRDAADGYADAEDAHSTRLASSPYGSAQILWKESDDAYYGHTTGEMWALVRLGGKTHGVVYALTGGGGIPGRSGTTLGSAAVTLYHTAGSALTLTAINATCYNGSESPVQGSAVVGMIARGDGTYDAVLESCSGPYYY